MTDRDRPDAVLIRAARDGSETALDDPVPAPLAASSPAAYLICQDRAGAEDIAQEAFLSAVRALDRFDRRRPFAPWLHRIVVNRAIDWTRMRAARAEMGDRRAARARERLPPTVPTATYWPSLAELEPEQRAVIVLRYVHDLTPGEIARALGLPRGTVNSRLRRGLDRMAGRARVRGAVAADTDDRRAAAMTERSSPAPARRPATRRGACCRADLDGDPRRPRPPCASPSRGRGRARPPVLRSPAWRRSPSSWSPSRSRARLARRSLAGCATRSGSRDCPRARPTLGLLPTGGQVLVTTPSGVWIVGAHGGRRRLGPGTGASLLAPQPVRRGVAGHELGALDLRGRRQWT